MPRVSGGSFIILSAVWLFLSGCCPDQTKTRSFAHHRAGDQHRLPHQTMEDYALPWTQASLEGRHFTVERIDNLPDIYGDVVDPDLVVFMGGNQFMVVEELMETFRRQHPQVEKVYVQTLPPGILEDQLSQGALVIGKTRFSHRPDVFMAGVDRIDRLQRQQQLFSRTTRYCSNGLIIMVARNNHHQVSRVEDLARPEVRVAMPNEEWEGVARMIREVYRNAGGEALEREIMQTKVEKGTTFITDIHHRQTPLWILQGYADAGVVWKTEVLHQQRLGHPITGIEIPDDENITSVSAAGVMAEAPHHEHATAFLEFLRSAAAQEIFQRYGFGRAPARDRHARHETSHPFTD